MFKKVDSEVSLNLCEENFIFRQPDNNILVDFFNIIINMDLPANINISPFSGLNSEESTIFLENFGSLCLVKNINDNNRRKALFHLHLTGPARSWYNALQENQKDTWEHLEESFNARYGGALDAAQRQVKSEEFASLRLLPGQNIDVYYGEIISKARLLNKTVEDMQGQFISGLPKQLAFFVRARNPATLEEALASAKMGDSFGYKETAESVNTIRPSNDEEMREMRAALRDLTAAVQSLQIAHVNQMTGMPPSESQHHPYPQPLQQPRQQQSSTQFQHSSTQFQPTSSTQFQPTSSTQQSNPPICLYCKCPGHIQRDCNIAARVYPRPDLTCPRCGQIGHGFHCCKQGN